MKTLFCLRYQFFYVELILDEMLHNFFCPEFCDEHQEYIDRAVTLGVFASK